MGVHGGTPVFPAGPGVEPGGLSFLLVASFAKVDCMLGRKTYVRKEIDRARAMVESDLAAYRRLSTAAKTKGIRVTEGKDGNPLNEVRVLCNSIMLNQGKLQVDKLPWWPMSANAGIKLPAEKSVLKLKVGDEVKFSEGDFVRLSAAFFAEFEKKYL